MATATRTAPATANKPATVTDVEVEVSKKAAKAFAELKTARHDMASAKARETAAKAAFYAALPKHKKGTRLILRQAGQVLGKVSWRAGQQRADLDLLMQGFPEAFEAVVARSADYQQIN